MAADESERSDSDQDSEAGARHLYELIGVTVHTGTAEGGHYYSIIRDKQSCNDLGQNKWYFFNDADVKSFDPSQIGLECFGGEMTSKTYDSVTDKFMDFSFERVSTCTIFVDQIFTKYRV